MKRLLILLSLGCLLAAPIVARAADPAGAAALRRSLYAIRLTAQRGLPQEPWKKGPLEARTGYALAVGTNLFLTTDQLVRDATLVEVSPAGSARYYPARVIRADRDLNLALLDVSSARLPEPPIPLELAALPFPGSRGDFYQFTEGGVLQGGGVQILRASMDAPSRELPPLLTLQFLCDIPLNGPGLPILQDGRLAGMAATYDRATKLGLLYPGRVLKRFIEDAVRPDYQGPAWAGLSWKALPDPARRRYLKVSDDDRGVEILTTVTGTDAAAVLQRGDVLLTWSGFPVDQQGYYDDPAMGRIPFPALIADCRPGDSVPVSFSRGGAVTQAVVRLSARAAFRRKVPEYDANPPEYLIEGGLVMRDLTGDYLRAEGSDWMRRANPRLVHLYLTEGGEDVANGARIPILAFSLPDTVNAGYQEFTDEVIVQANGEPVNSLKDIRRIRKRDGFIRSLRLLGLDVDLVLDPEELPAANARIAESYRIPTLQATRK
jgi:hypothetical protein